MWHPNGQPTAELRQTSSVQQSSSNSWLQVARSKQKIENIFHFVPLQLFCSHGAWQMELEGEESKRLFFSQGKC
jgi:hypothetical protein